VKAIVLTHDPQIGLADLVVRAYRRLLGRDLFEFRIPVNGASARARMRGHACVHCVPSAPAIQPSMAALLEGVRDEEWVYWAIDDRYPVRVDPGRFLPLHDAILQGTLDRADGIKLLRWREPLESGLLSTPAGHFQLQRKRCIWGFWHHHFLKGKVLKSAFLGERAAAAPMVRDLNRLLQEFGWGELEQIYVPCDGPLVHLGEPLLRGRLTLNGVQALQAHGCEVPAYKVRNVHAHFYDWDAQRAINPKHPARVPAPLAAVAAAHAAQLTQP